MKKLTFLVTIFAIIALFTVGVLYIDYTEHKTLLQRGVFTGFNEIQGGYNVFLQDQNTLFLNGNDWRVRGKLEKCEVNKTYTFYYHKVQIDDLGSDTGLWYAKIFEGVEER